MATKQIVPCYYCAAKGIPNTPAVKHVEWYGISATQIQIRDLCQECFAQCGLSWQTIIDIPAEAVTSLSTLGAMTAAERKQSPLFRGLFKYFPDALVEIAHVSYVGNEQHHPGAELHWDKSKSTDEADALLRHQMQAGTMDTDGLRHSAKVAWRALAQLQREIEGKDEP